MQMGPRLGRLWLALSAVTVLSSCQPMVLHFFEPKFLTTGADGAETPAMAGVPFERMSIASGNRTLYGNLVEAPAECGESVEVLIFHGIGETNSDWVNAQRYLREHCLTTLVFDYSGHGDSSRPGTVAHINSDAVAAYTAFKSRVKPGRRICTLAHSLGNGPMLDALPKFQPQPDCVVVANAFTSLRDAGAHNGTPRVLTYMMPDVWNNVESIAHVHSRLLVVHSDADTVNPIAMGERVFQGATEPKQLVVLHGFKHNALYRDPTDAWWSAVLEFLIDRLAGDDHP